MYINVQIIAETKNSTLSSLSIEGVHVCFVIEDGFRLVKEHGQTRIPYGEYELIKRFEGRHYDQYSKRFKHDCTFQVANVPNFKWIMLHIGNTVVHTDGCPLLNTGVAVDANGDYRGTQSAKAYLKFYDIVRPVIDEEKVFINFCR